jgi:ribosomal protein L28
MPRMCTICGKTYSRTIKRSHSMRASIRRLLPNLQWTRVDGQRVKACARCIKTQSKLPRSERVTA